jgi:ribosomal protein S17E
MKDKIAYGLAVAVDNHCGDVIKGIITNEYALLYVRVPKYDFNKTLKVMESPYINMTISRIHNEVSHYITKVINSDKILKQYDRDEDEYFWENPIKCGDFEISRQFIGYYLNDLRTSQKQKKLNRLVI